MTPQRMQRNMFSKCFKCISLFLEKKYKEKEEKQFILTKSNQLD